MTLAVERDIYREYRDAVGSDRERLEEELIVMHEGLVYMEVNRKYGTYIERDDLIQIGMESLLKAIRKFDPATGMQFSTYAIPTIRGYLNNEYRKLKQDKRKALTLASSLDVQINGDPESRTLLEQLVDDEKSVEDEVLSRITDAEFWGVAHEILTRNELRAMKLKYSDLQPTNAEISRIMDVSLTRPFQLIRAAESKLKRYYSGEEIVRQPAEQSRWTKEEVARLRQNILDGVKPKEIYKVFRRRTKHGVDRKIKEVRKQLKKEGLL